MSTTRAEPHVAPRAAAALMRPERLGALQPTRLSFSRSLIEKMTAERWRITRPEFDIDERGHGSARYHVEAPGDWSFEFVLFSNEPNPDERTDRIIGRHWDMMGALLEGSADDSRIRQTRRELPKLYGGRAAPGTLVWCRSNRSMRAFDLTLDSLAGGEQPPVDVLASVCYLMRNTGLDGNGTFGTKTFAAYEADHPLRTPLHAQMLAAYLMREFSMDLVEHLAALRSPAAVPLAPELRRFLGLGNASGLGLMFFAKNHPLLLDRWLGARERALAAARSTMVSPVGPELATLEERLHRLIRYRAQDRMRYVYALEGKVVADQLRAVRDFVGSLRGSTREEGRHLDAVYSFAAREVGLEAQESVNSLLIDLIEDHADPYAADLAAQESVRFDPTARVGDLLDVLARDYSWALSIDVTSPEARHYAWYKSANAEEPRRGPLSELPADFDDLTPDIATAVQAVHHLLHRLDPATPLGEVVTRHPEHRAIIERVHALRNAEYHTVHANPRHVDFNPSQIIRLFNSAVHGLAKTKEDGAVGVVGIMFHGAPTPADIAEGRAFDWGFPEEPETENE